MKQSAHSSMSPWVKGVIAGTVVGTTTYLLVNKKEHPSNTWKRSAGKALKTIGTVMENVSYMMN